MSYGCETLNRDIALVPPEGDRQIQKHEESPQDNVLSLDLPVLLRIIREWRWMILSTVVAGMALGVAYTMLSTPMYRASVILQVNPPTVQILNEQSGDRAPDTTPWDFVATQVGLLSSRSLAERVAQDLNLANNPLLVPQESDPKTRLRDATAKIEDGLDVIPPQEGQLIKFSYSSPSPGLSAQVANGIADAFINSNLQRRYESSAYARTFLERQIGKTRGDLERSERALVSYAQAQGIINTSDQGENALSSAGSSPQGESLTAINKALADATARRVEAEGAYRAAMSSGITSAETDSSQNLRQSRAALQAEYQQKRTLLKPDHPDMIALRSSISELDKQITRENSSITSARINSLRNNYKAAVDAERALQARVGQLKSEVLDLRGRSIRYAILQRDVDTNRALYDALLQRYKEIGVAGGIGTAPVSIVDHADTPSSPYKPNLLSDLLIGLALGLGLGVLGAIILEYLNDTIKDREDVRTKLGLACLGTVPKVPARGEFIDDLRDPTSTVSDAYSTVAASLGFSTETGVPRILLLTSTRPSEGKSSSALALAQNYSRRGRSVLLIDCDLRKPAFKSPSNDVGLTKLLTNSDPVSAHVSETHFENLWLLASGPVPPNPADLLSTGRFNSIIHEASRQFDIVIIDAPPVIGLADAPLIASMCKDVMFIVEAGKTRTVAAREAVSKLRAAGAHILGAALTKTNIRHAGYGYGYGYGYGNRQKYGAVDKNRTEIELLPEQADA